MAETQANDVVLLQQVLIDNLQELGFRSITAERIGDSEGVPDGILGDGTSTALHVLAIMAQIEANVDPNEMTTGYNADSAPLITAYIEKYASPEAAAQFAESIQSVYPGGEFNQDYDEATINTDNAARELNVAEFRRLGEGAVSITQGTPPPAFSTSPLKDQITAMQEVIFTGQILEQIGMQADQIGNYQTGEADGILGKGTSEALQKLVILSERAAGRDGEEITGVYDATLVQTYLEANGVTAEDAQKFVDNAGQLNGNLQTLYATTEVDPATVQLADNGSNADENVADNDSRNITMNYAQYEYLSAVATSEAGTAEDNLVTLAYKTAMDARAEEIGLTEQETLLHEKREEYARMVGADTSGYDAAALEAHLAASDAFKAETEALQADVDTLKAQLQAANIEFTVPEGVGNEQLAAIRTSIATVETTQVAMTIEDDALNGSTLGTSDTLGPLGPVPISSELDGMPTVFGPSPEEIGSVFVDAGDTARIVSMEVESVAAEGSIFATYEQYSDLKDETLLTDDQRVIVDGYEAAYEAALQDAGIGEARTRLEAAEARMDGFQTEWNGIQDQRAETNTKMEGIVDTLKDTPIQFTVEIDGEEQSYTYSYNQVQEMDANSWNEIAFDGGREEKIYDAGRQAYADALAAHEEYQQLSEQRDAFDAELRGGKTRNRNATVEKGDLYQEISGEVRAAQRVIDQIEGRVQETALAVAPLPVEDNPALLVGADSTVQTQSLGG